MSKYAVGRQQIIDTLKADLEGQDFVRAAWLGGSDASGRTDEWSDVDLQMIVEDDCVEKTYAAVHTAIETLSPISLRFRFPQPMWHGHEQEVLQLRDAGPYAFLDLVIIQRGSEADRFLERERHGEAMVLFDKDGLVEPPPFDRDKHMAKLAERLPVLRTQFALFQNLVTKAVRRGFPVEAAYVYQRWTLIPLVELLRMRYCPDLYDYGPRYLDRDLPGHLLAELEGLALPRTLEELESNQERAIALFEESARAHDAGEWSAP